jgi:hypothetical protein
MPSKTISLTFPKKSGQVAQQFGRSEDKGLRKQTAR